MDQITSWQQLCDAVDEIGFLPLLPCNIPNFSVQDWTPAEYWQEHGPNNPWGWRYKIVQSGRIVYGKFFQGKIGFISKAWFPAFANVRRNGYAFDALCDEGQAPFRWKNVMQCVGTGGVTSVALKRLCALGEKQDKTLTELMMHTYLVISGFEQKKNKYGEDYEWPVARYDIPERCLTDIFTESPYSETPEASFRKISEQLQRLMPDASPKAIEKLLRG